MTETAQVGTNFTQELMNLLPTARDLNATLLLAPSVHPTGPAGAFSIAGSLSFENLFLVNGVTVNENLRGKAPDLYIEDAVQETTVATAGISAEFGRFSGGVVNVITKSGGNSFSGSFRDTLNNDNWRQSDAVRDRRPSAVRADVDLRVDKVVPTYEYTFGGPVMRDRLWFFTAGRLQKQESGRNTAITSIPYTFIEDSKRFEFKGTYSLNTNHRFQGAYTKSYRHAGEQHVQPEPVDGPGQPRHARAARGSLHVQLHRRPDLEALRRGPLFEPALRASSAPGRASPTSSTARCCSTAAAATPATGPTPSAASATPTRSATTRTSSSRARTSCRRRAPARTA